MLKFKPIFEKSFVKVEKCLQEFNIALLGQIIEKQLSLNECLGQSFKAGEVEIALNFVSLDTIKFYNSKYKKHNAPTDVISFRYDEYPLLGELYISPFTVAQNARKFKVSFCEELFRVIIHGTLHICGYTHGSKMFAIQENILDNFLDNLKDK